MTERAENNAVTRRNRRLYAFYAVILISTLALLSGLGYRQLVLGDDYKLAEERQNYRRILTPGPRGDIFDREGRLLVGNRPVFTAAVYLNELRREFRREYFDMVREMRDRRQMPDRQSLNVQARARVVQRYLDEVNEILDRAETVEPRHIERHFSQSLLLPFPLVVDMSPQEYARLVERIPVESPLQVVTETARYYPHNRAAAHALGYVSTTREFAVSETAGDGLLTFRQTASVGRDGLERHFDDRLQGSVGFEIWSVDPGGFQHERVFHELPVRGASVTTSIDIDLQRAADEGLGEHAGAVVAIDIRTGEVLAMTSKPDFDLNNLSPRLTRQVFDAISDEGGWLNRAVQGLYPPGSTFKLVTALAAARAGHVDADTVIHCPGFHIVGNRTFRCHNRAGHGDEDLVEAIRDSCNVFFYERGLRTGIRHIAAEARRFGLDHPTGIELPGETRRMLIPDPDWKARRFYGESWFEGDTANVSIGQGDLLITPMGMAAFVASLARGETRTRPTLARIGPDEIVDHGGEPIGIDPGVHEKILEGMREAGRAGTARLAGSPTMPVAGKTGTAQVRKDGRPTTLAWFVGYAPANSPRVAISVVIEGVPDTGTTYGGGAMAAPVARRVFEAYVNKQSLLTVDAR
ncbi:MAG: penicillin-binding protein 2 [Opitutales bacterium]|nr:penicillin-binding protein 2 [Opitutales bacterium]